MLQRLIDLSQDLGFSAFQNDLAVSLYDQLGQGYNSAEGEVALVTRMAKTANGTSYGPLTIHADKIHGKRSYVEFKHRDKPVTKELGDLALIGIITNGTERLFSRITIVQNKKATKASWSVDEEQLFLLKNFPSFSGNKGLFPYPGQIQFRNQSNCLGSYGLFHEPGEMIFLSASHVAELQRGKKSLTMADISVLSGRNGHNGNGLHLGFPFAFFHHPIVIEEFLHFFERFFHRFPLSPKDLGYSFGFLDNVLFSRDLFELIRHWTQISVGEPTFAFGQVLNQHVDDLLYRLLQQIGIGGMFEPTGRQQDNVGEFDNDFSVMAVHLDIGKG